MLDLDTIERVVSDLESGPVKLHLAARRLLDELRKCRAAMREAVGLILQDESNCVDAVATLNDAMRGAK